MAGSIDRRAFLRRAGTAAAALMGAPLVNSSRATAASDRLVVAVGQWGIETPLAWRSSQSEKTLWDCVHDYNPIHKGYSADWKIPPYDPERAKKLLGEAGHGGGFEVRVNPMVFTYALDGADVMEAVALDWEKIGIKVRRIPEAFGNFLPKNRARKTNKTHWVYGAPPFDEPGLGWQRTVHSKGAFNLLCDGPYDQEIDAILRELDAEKRARMTHDLGQKLYDGYHGVMLGVRSTTWALSKQVSGWQTLVSVPLENNYEYVS